MSFFLTTEDRKSMPLSKFGINADDSVILKAQGIETLELFKARPSSLGNFS